MSRGGARRSPATGTPTTSASTGRASRPRRRPRRPVRVAVAGAGGRLGRALVEALENAPFTGLAGPIAWTRHDFDLDAPDGITALLDRDRPEAVVNAAAWTDVDGCA